MLGIQTRSLQCRSDAVERGSPAVSVLMMMERAYYIDVFLVVFIILALLWIIKIPIPKKVSEPLFKSFIGFL
ncbi:hypothetical protein Krac_6869 [Ktedonobacter racemifer DSM 44963]|uniref:Uncharacterized protein n=1 Tax=Ktedonobacter racemifer DSM 44963 TaxID=485913 RepID=D6TPM8_KTERA|nr:hypothetical protein Krac_6869 [Ktedonobacter racemifer DSM 44963]